MMCEPAQIYTPNQIPGGIGNNPELEQLLPEMTDVNIEDLLPIYYMWPN